jgi:hypothetical protein
MNTTSLVEVAAPNQKAGGTPWMNPLYGFSHGSSRIIAVHHWFHFLAFFRV